jgi:uncharacterized protein
MSRQPQARTRPPVAAARAAAPLAVTGLFVYPLKSAAGIPLERAEIDSFGIRHDRRWMIVQPDGRFITQRDEHRLALVKTELTPGALRLTAPAIATLELPHAGPGADAPRLLAGVWEGAVGAADAGADAAGWITAVLGRPARIVFMPDDVLRPVDPHYASGSERVSFADGFPLLLIGQASLDQLNSRLAEPLPMNRFRPNMVIAGAAPHAEDDWRRFRVGDDPGVVFACVKPCARCVVTTIDQATGKAGREPLRTLASYRRGPDGGVLFGQNLIHDAPGEISLHDVVNILD